MTKYNNSIVYKPKHYCYGNVEAIEIIEEVVEDLPAKEAYLLGNVLKYVLRAGKKGDIGTDLSKANNYAHRLVFGRWLGEPDIKEKDGNPDINLDYSPKYKQWLIDKDEGLEIASKSWSPEYKKWLTDHDYEISESVK